MKTAFYCVADERYFLGAVAMINSLRARGHDEPVFLLDCGLTAAQRRVLAPQVSFVEAPSGVNPFLLTAMAPLAHPAETMVLIDTDMIVNARLDQPIAQAADGFVVAFRTSYERWLAEWAILLELGELRPGPYLSGGLVLLGGERRIAILRKLESLFYFVDLDFSSRKLPPYPSDYPFVALDQDVLNAVLATREYDELRVALEHRLAPNQPFAGLELEAHGERCAYADGTRPFVVHHLAAKPWQRPMPSSVFSRLLVHYLSGPDLAIRLPTRAVPSWLRAGPRGRLTRLAIDTRDRVGWRLRHAAPKPLMDRVDAARARRTGAAG